MKIEKIKLEDRYYLDKYGDISEVVVMYKSEKMISVLHLSTGIREKLSKYECEKYLKL